MINDMPSGMSNLPSIPLKKNNGIKLATIMSEELKIGILTSDEELYTTSITEARLSAGRSLFCRNRLYTFSTSTIASSTSEPIAIAMPPRLIVLMVYPKKWSEITVIIIDNGRATSDIIVVRMFIKKKNKIITTKTAPSISARWMLEIELLINEDCLKISVEILIPSGIDFRASSNSSSICAVNLFVSIFGCFVIVNNTAG